MIDRDAVGGALDSLIETINSTLSGLEANEAGTVLANLTIRLFRTCERDLSEESMERLAEAIESDEDDDAEMERSLH